MQPEIPTAGPPEEPAAPTLGAVLVLHGRASPAPTEAGWVTLIHSISHGDQLALQVLYRRTHRLVFTIVMRITNDRETAEELTLDVFHDVWRKASGYDPANGTVIGWIMNRARSRAIDRLRYEQRRKRVDPHPHSPALSVEGREPDAVIDRDRARVVRTAVAALAAEERLAIEYAFFRDLTYVEVAEQLNQPVGTVKTRIRTGLRRLRTALAAAGEAAI